MSVFVPVCILAFAFLYTVTQIGGAITVATALEKSKNFSANFTPVVVIDLILCVAAAITGSMV